MPWLDRARAAHLRGAGPDRPGLRRALRASRRSGSPAASRRVRAHLPRLVRACWRPLGVDLAMTTNGVQLPEMAHDLAAAGPAAGQRLARLAAPRDVPRAHPPRRARPGARRDRRRARRRARPGEGQLRRDPRRQRRRGRRPRRVRARARASACASSSSCRSTPTGEWTMDQVVPGAARSSTASTRCSRSSDAGRRRTTARTSSPRRAFRYADGIGDVGVIASVTEPFCEQLRPGPDHRRGQVPHLPVRARRDRPARDPARRRRRRRARRPARGRDRPGRRHEVGRPPHRPGRLRPPDRSMSQIGG